jgi:hypothetical protein
MNQILRFISSNISGVSETASASHFIKTARRRGGLK